MREAGDGLAVALPDAFPVARGHTLIVPRRHEPDYFALTDSEQGEMWRLVSALRAEIGARLSPDGFTIGVNVGAAAGQTVDHAHIHLIPRYRGDVADPRGGVRWVIPERARYWER